MPRFPPTTTVNAIDSARLQRERLCIIKTGDVPKGSQWLSAAAGGVGMDSIDTASHLVLRLVIILGIAVLFPAMTFLGTASVLDRPERPDFAGTYPSDESTENRAKFLESLRTMQAEYGKQQKAFARVIFWVAMPLGLAAIGAGLFRRLGDIGIGFLLAGIATLVFAYCGTREHYGADAVSAIVALIGLVLLILIARRRLVRDTEA
jgi:hypothetical protein